MIIEKLNETEIKSVSFFFEPLTGPSQGVEEESDVQFLWQ
jgi:hypothetical protein